MSEIGGECPICGQGFVPRSPRQVYCSDRCKSRAQNQRFYRRHRDKMIQRVQQYRIRRKLSKN